MLIIVLLVTLAAVTRLGRPYRVLIPVSHAVFRLMVHHLNGAGLPLELGSSHSRLSEFTPAELIAAQVERLIIFPYSHCLGYKCEQWSTANHSSPFQVQTISERAFRGPEFDEKGTGQAAHFVF